MCVDSALGLDGPYYVETVETMLNGARVVYKDVLLALAGVEDAVEAELGHP